MNGSLNARALALAGAAASAMLVLLCFALYAALGRPDPWRELFVGSAPTVMGWLIGIAEGALVGLFLGAAVGILYNRFSPSRPVQP
jgi:hypothetical protein